MALVGQWAEWGAKGRGMENAEEGEESLEVVSKWQSVSESWKIINMV